MVAAVAPIDIPTAGGSKKSRIAGRIQASANRSTLEGSIAAAAVARQKKKQKEIEAAAAKTEQERLAKLAAKDPLEEKHESTYLDSEKKERIHAVADQVEEERQRRISTLKGTGEEETYLDSEKKERIQAVADLVEEERKKRLSTLKDNQAEEEWMDEAKKERIQAAAAKIEAERMAKFNSDKEESHEWKKPETLGTGPKPTMFGQSPKHYVPSSEYRGVGEIDTTSKHPTPEPETAIEKTGEKKQDVVGVTQKELTELPPAAKPEESSTSDTSGESAVVVAKRECCIIL